ncbi:hypothetical protein [Streptomyces hoynatensis]|uniref:Uncharacterized protein n=1 Tax=Streptomyces hoynatensis TaxID=1141874 RepID=A0A3A9Z9F3_9ACTN|nr:hypothetical protein [Streptomyces hoynatensis]RKN44940.1 hypothetical protein D7294_07480 [Streptomyces hoynatensis]
MDASTATRTYRIESGPMALELLQEGRLVRLRLCHGEETFLDGELGGMLLLSTGRPWRPAHPGLRSARVRRTDGALTVSGTVGGLAAELSFAFAGGTLRAALTWRNAGERPLRDLTAGLALHLPEAGPEAVTLPQVLYRGNPSADPGRPVPRLGRGPHGGLVVEEHRLPVPCAHAEWQPPGGPRFLTVYALDPGEGSLGALAGERTSLLALSGPVMFDGEADVAYTHKATTSPHHGGYRELAPGGAFTLGYALHWGRPARPGHGFRDLVHRGLRLYAPAGAAPLSLDRMIELKSAAMDRRWREGPDVAGYLKFPGPGHEPGFLYGWTGQCLRLAWCDARLGLERGEEWRLARCRRAVDFYLEGSAAGAPEGLRLACYGLADGRWTTFERGGVPFVSARAYGDTLGDLADIVTLFADRGLPVPERWTTALAEGLDAVCRGLTPEGLVPLGWRLADGAPLPAPPGSAGLPCVLALLKSQRAVPSRRRFAAAAALFERYRQAHAEDFSRPFSHATLDAACEDKEAGMAFFQCAYEMLLTTGHSRYLDVASAAADWLLTWVYQWNPGHPPGSPLAERGFDATGWPGVSVQNHHLDVFFPVPELARFGELAERPEYTRLARLIMHALGQGVCTGPGEWDFAEPGEQGEGFYPTNWQERGTSNTWNPSWVTAHPLANALRLRGAPPALGG